MKNSPWIFLFLIFDYLSALLAWALFFYLRKTWIENEPFEADNNFWLGLFLIPIFWMFLYFIQGTYQEMRRMFRLKLLNLTLSGSIMGSLVIFFAIILDDQVRGYEGYYWNALILFGVHFVVTAFPRLFINTLLIHSIRGKGKGFKTVIIGGTDKAVEIHKEIIKNPNNVNTFIGYVNMNGNDRKLDDVLPYLGHFDQLDKVISSTEVLSLIHI